MPNPLRKVVPKGTPESDFHPGAIEKNPKMAARVLSVLSAWAKLDAEMGIVFARFLGTQSHIGAAIYNQFSNLNTQDNAMRAAAELVLNRDQLDVFYALRKASKSPRDQRNEIAHGIWGYCKEVPDGLVLWSPKESLRLRGDMSAIVEQIRMHRDFGVPFPQRLADKFVSGVDVAELIMVYREPDIAALEKQIRAAEDLWSDFAKFIWLSSQTERDEARRRLLAHTAIRKAVDEARSLRGEPPLPQP
jgi:hypothetical protein